MPDNVIRKAAFILAQYLRGEIHPRKCVDTCGHYLVFNVGFRWRLLCKNPDNSKNPNAWDLLTHERYSSEISKR